MSYKFSDALKRALVAVESIADEQQELLSEVSKLRYQNHVLTALVQRKETPTPTELLRLSCLEGVSLPHGHPLRGLNRTLYCVDPELLPTSGIYFLFRDRQLVYVGKSQKMLSRLSSHSVKYDEAMFMRLPSEELDITEAALIRFFNPPDNGTAGAAKATAEACAAALTQLGMYVT